MSTPTAKGLSTLVRPKFGPGMLLQHEDLDLLSSYPRELNRLLFRSLFGCGVVCGLVVTIEEDCKMPKVTIGSGLALNCSGDPIYVPTGQEIVIDPKGDFELKDPLWVELCPTAKCCAPRTSMCPTDEDEVSSVATREREGFEIRVVDKEPKCSCRCAPPDKPKEHKSDCWCVDPELPCYATHYAGVCDCDCEDCTTGGCDCVLLARLTGLKGKPETWKADHSVRRFVRPVLMRDPQVYLEAHPLKAAKKARR